MPGFNPDNINVYDLIVEEPEKEVELPFDPKVDLTEEDWKQIRSRVAGHHSESLKENNWKFFCSTHAT